MYEMIITRTPFRISFFGGGTDYPVWYEKNGGAVLSTTINKHCYVTCRYLPPFFDCNYRIRYREQEETKTIREIKHLSVRECLNYLRFRHGIEMQHNADLPAMSGLGSSSAFTVGFLNALYALQGKEATKHQLALDAIHVEQECIKENVGSQDQTAAAFGGFNKIEFGGDTEIRVTPVAVNGETLASLQKNLMLVFIGYARNASDVAAAQIQSTPEKAAELTRMRQMVDEAENILVRERGLEDFGYLLHEGWQIKRGLTPKISSPVIDEIYEAARSAGALGGKLLGAGSGGFMLFFVSPELQKRVRERLGKLLHVPFRFEQEGSKVIYRMSNDEKE